MSRKDSLYPVRLVLVDTCGEDPDRFPLKPLLEVVKAAETVRIPVSRKEELEEILFREGNRETETVLVLTFGRIACGDDDWVPEATSMSIAKDLPALATALRLRWVESFPQAYFYRNRSGVRGQMMVVNLPDHGEQIEAVIPLLTVTLPHAIEKIAGDQGECGR